MQAIKKLISSLLVILSGAAFSQPNIQNIEISRGAVEYEIKGNGDHIVLFEAGAISGMAGWDSIWQKLPDDITAIRYSRIGEGNSSVCHGELTAADYLKDSLELLQKLSVKQPVIHVSHSYGGKIARYFAANYPRKIKAMLLVDPSNPRDVDIVKQVDPINGKRANQELKVTDIQQGEEHGWCLINDLWDKSPAYGYGDIKDLPITLIAGVKKHQNPKRIFDRDEARQLWGQYQKEWVQAFPQGRAVMAETSGHFVQNDQPELVLEELNKLLAKLNRLKE